MNIASISIADATHKWDKERVYYNHQLLGRTSSHFIYRYIFGKPTPYCSMDDDYVHERTQNAPHCRHNMNTQFNARTLFLTIQHCGALSLQNSSASCNSHFKSLGSLCSVCIFALCCHIPYNHFRFSRPET